MWDLLENMSELADECASLKGLHYQTYDTCALSAKRQGGFLPILELNVCYVCWILYTMYRWRSLQWELEGYHISLLYMMKPSADIHVPALLQVSVSWKHGPLNRADLLVSLPTLDILFSMPLLARMSRNGIVQWNGGMKHWNVLPPRIKCHNMITKVMVTL